ncbi:hypothetical protein PGIGA_G00183840 [Pangasianodon gigas]|uniref:Uncharacterized protein n=1 Tax=Pangasianodon gigas TaxID=30993 RepID=A0ACC5WB58_PANGG|nr:hypothetical protein [Pangasianodon gigas]
MLQGRVKERKDEGRMTKKNVELDWLLADEDRANRLLSSSLPWVMSPLSELFRESLRAERDDDVLLLSLRGLLEFRPVQQTHTSQAVERD